MLNYFPTRTLVLITIITALALLRLLPHPPNFTPIAAMALFGGAFFSNKKMAFIAPFAAMLISDLIIGFHGMMVAVYISFGICVLIGQRLKNKTNPLTIASSALLCSVLFFVFTNFAVWMEGTNYTFDLVGLITCYIAAIPFFHYTLIGDLLFTGILFGGFIYAQQRYPILVKG